MSDVVNLLEDLKTKILDERHLWGAMTGFVNVEDITKIFDDAIHDVKISRILEAKA